ncbi:unnamed protein product [Urochloa decumbens]|uniref:Uncharacterized protein n=1 Tax=Urochloa decumbens TaxID=240449 RepID=A0ABC8XMM5_9POAL
MDGGHRGGWGLRRGGYRREGQRRSGQRIPARRRGYWISLCGRNRGAIVQEGVDFAQDSEVGGGDDFLFLSDSEEEVSNDSNDRSFVTHSEDLGVGDAPASPVMEKSRRYVPLSPPKQSSAIWTPITSPQHSDRMEAVAWQDIAGHSQLPEEEEAYEEHTEQHEKNPGADNEFCEVRDSMLRILVPLYFQDDGK